MATKQLHDESAHDLLAPHDLIHHLPDHHHIFAYEVLEQSNSEVVAEYIKVNGIEPADEGIDTDDEILAASDLDALVVWHEKAHRAAEQ